MHEASSPEGIGTTCFKCILDDYKCLKGFFFRFFTAFESFLAAAVIVMFCPSLYRRGKAKKKSSAFCLRDAAAENFVSEFWLVNAGWKIC